MDLTCHILAIAYEVWRHPRKEPKLTFWGSVLLIILTPLTLINNISDNTVAHNI